MSARTEKMRLRFLILAVLWAASRTCEAQAVLGGVRGTVYDREFSMPVGEAVLRLDHAGVETKTTADGHFLFEGVEPGAHVLTVTKAGYERFVVSSVVVMPGELTDVNVTLKGEYVDMEEFVVRDLPVEDTGTELGLLNLRGTSLALQDSISADLMSKAGASDAAGALKLVVGTSVVDGKYATVRGLSDRYVGTAMNGLRVPSSDPKRRAVHMDVFPAGTIKSISVKKTFSPDLPGDYSGGGIDIETMAIPEKPFFKASFSREENNMYSGKGGFVTYEGAGCGTWGRHNGLRDMPEGAETMEDDGLNQKGLESHHDALSDREHPHDREHRAYTRITRDMAPAMGVKRTRVPDSFSYSLSGGGKLALGSDWAVGGTTAFTYSHKYELQRSEDKTLIKPAKTDPTDESVFESLRDTGTEEVKWSQLLALGIGKGDEHSVTLTAIRNRAAEDQASVRVEEHDAESTILSQQQAIHYSERSIDALQLKGTHKWDRFFGDLMGLHFDWYGARNKVEQEEPDVRSFKNYVVKRDNGWWQFQPQPDGTSGADEDRTTRAWRNTREDNTQYGLDLALPFSVLVPDLQGALPWGDGVTWSEQEGKLKFGKIWDLTYRWYRQDSFYYAFAKQMQPTYTGPLRADFGRGSKGYLAWLAAQEAWYEGMEGQSYLKAMDDTQADGEKRTYLAKDPDALWTDVFTDEDRLGTGRYQDSMYWYILPKFRDVDYTGRQDLRASYLMFELPLTKHMTFMYGGRVERTDMTIEPTSDGDLLDPETAFIVPVENTTTNANGSVSTFYSLDGVARDEARAELHESEWLRAAGVVYEVVTNMNLRFNWSQTIARPTFLEMAPVITFDYVEGEAVIGNKDLIISHVENYDLRWEWFMRPGDVLAASWFYKKIHDPIEKESFGYLNQDYLLAVNYPWGEVRGMEFEARVALDFMPAPLHLFSVGANYTLIDATVEIPEFLRNGLEFHNLGQEYRDMEGQPDHLLNMNVTCDIKDWGTTVSLFYNERGDMLKSGASVGDKGATPNIYSLERGTMNVSVKQNIGKHWNLTLRAKNILDPDVEEVYREPDGTETPRRRYSEGTTYSVTAGTSW